jgi:hypothetical protein
VLRVPSQNDARRIGLAAAALVIVAACVGPFPRRVPGSDMTLPRSTGTWLLESLIDCANQTAQSGLAPARDGATCRMATGDTVPDPSPRLTRPPVKIP